MAKDDDDRDDDREDETIEPTTLDESSHAELRMLYWESTETLRFAKNLQWRTVGATLLVFGGLIAVAAITDANAHLTNKLMALALLMTVGSLFTLVVHQLWQFNETGKIESMNDRFSSLFKTVRAKRSKLEGNIFRYVLLLFMMIVVILGVVVTNLALTRIAMT